VPDPRLVANHGAFHGAVDAFDGGFVLRRMCEVLGGAPSDDAACGGCKAFEWLVKYKSYQRLPTLRPQDVHDVVIPLWLHKEDAAKDAAGKALRHVLSNKAWMDEAMEYFNERGSTQKLSQVIQEMNEFEALKEMRTTGKRQDQLRPSGQPLESTLESESRRETLNPPKVVEHLGRDLEPRATIVDVGAGTGIFTFAFAAGLPEATVYSLEVRTDALQTLNARQRAESAANVHVMRMADGTAPALPENAKADLVFLCDVLDFVPAHLKEGFLLSLRALLAPEGRLVVIESRDHWETHLVDIQDAGFLQKRMAQIVAVRRIMAFDADPDAPPPPPSQSPPPALPEDTQPPPKEEPVKQPTYAPAEPPPKPVEQLSPDEEFNRRANASGYDLTGSAAKSVGSYGRPEDMLLRMQEERRQQPTAEVDDDDDLDDGCLLEENPSGGAADAVDVADDDDDDGCLLEENPSGAPGAADDDDDDDDCLLEDNPTAAPPGGTNGSAEIDSDEDCMLEEN